MMYFILPKIWNWEEKHVGSATNFPDVCGEKMKVFVCLQQAHCLASSPKCANQQGKLQHQDLPICKKLQKWGCTYLK